MGLKIALGLVLVGAALWFSLPDVSKLKNQNPSHTALMGQRGGAVYRFWTPLSHISPHLQRAVIVAEDAAFYEHEGVDLHEMKESIIETLRRGRLGRGFSTISMQLAKNLYLSPKKTVGRKLRQILIAIKMEVVLSKPRILELYLNSVEWGDHVYGVEAASLHYFFKKPADLSPADAAFLAAILPNPRGWGRLPPLPNVAQRQALILRRMGFSPPEEEIEPEPESM